MLSQNSKFLDSDVHTTQRNSKRKNIRKEPAARSEASLRPATPDQIAKIESLIQQIHLDAAEANQPYAFAFTITLTTLAFSFLLGRKDALFHQHYLNLLETLFKNNPLPGNLREQAFEKVTPDVEIDIAVAQENCLRYYDKFLRYLKVIEETSPAARTMFERNPNGMIENFLVASYARKDAAAIAYHNCFGLCKEFFDTVRDLTPESRRMLIGSDTKLEKLNLHQLFQTILKITEIAAAIPHAVDKARDGFVNIHAQLLAYEQQSVVLNLAKMSVIGIGHHISASITKRITKLIRPYGIPNKHLELFQNQSLSLLSEAKAENYLEELNPHALYIKRIAERNTAYMRNIYILLAFLAFTLMLTSGFTGIPGELAFFLVAVAGAGSYQLICYADKVKSRYQLNSRIKSTLDILDDSLKTLNDSSKKVFSITETKPEALELVQFKINSVFNYKNISLEDMRLILTRCLKNHGIHVISSETWPLIIGYNEKITIENIKKIKAHFDICIERLVELHNTTEKLKKIKNVFSSGEEYFSCNKYFDHWGVADATWHLSSYSKDHAIHLQELLGKQRCSWHSQSDNNVIIQIQGLACTKDLNFEEIIRDVKLKKTQPLPAPKTELISESKSESRPGTTTVKNSRTPKTSSSVKNAIAAAQPIPEEAPTEEKTPSLERLPKPYQDAQRISAPFLSAHAHIWALFQGDPKQFPTDECYDKFRELFTKPAIVPDEGEQGLVHDPERSTPKEQRHKAKLLGTFGKFGMKGPVVDISVKFSTNGEPEAVSSDTPRSSKERVLIFNELFMRH